MKTRFHVANNYRSSGKLTPIRFFTLIAAIIFIVLLLLDLFYRPNGGDILVEFHGLFFDLLVFGILITTYETWNKRRERIDLLHDQLDDYWDWKIEEGILRKVGIIKRLIELNHPIPRMTAIQLQNADFFSIKFNRLLLQDSNLENAKFNWTELNDSLLSGNFRYSNFEHSKFQNSTILQSDFESANMQFVDFAKTEIRGNVRFIKTNFHCADFRNVSLRPEAFGYPDFDGADLSEADFCGVDLTYCKGLTRKQIDSAKTNKETKLPDYL